MCGILCLLSRSAAPEEPDRAVLEALRRRGPDCSRDVWVPGPESGYGCRFSAHVLHMRGVVTPQPLLDAAGNVLLWNGEIFGGLRVEPDQNDAAVLSQRLQACGTAAEVLAVLSAVRGPWALVYHQRAAESLWFGRDFFGRRSLLWSFAAGTMTLTSVAALSPASDPRSWQEVPAAGVFRVDLKRFARSDSVCLEVFPWDHPDVPSISPESLPMYCQAVRNRAGLTLSAPVPPLNGSLPGSGSDPPASDPPASDPPASDPPASDPPTSGSDPPAFNSDPPASDPPASDPPTSGSDPPAFNSDPPASDPPASDPPTSGSDPPAFNSDPPASDPPASDPPASDPPTSDLPASDPPASDPPASDLPTSDLPARDLDQLLAGSEGPDEETRLIRVLSEAVRKRVQAPPPPAGSAAVAVLFSGGIDSMMLAALADRHVPAQHPIDLLNVAFRLREPQNRRRGDPTATRTLGPFDAPDRLTGRAGLEELRGLNPERRWNFVEIDVTPEELRDERRRRIRHLVLPLDSVLDDGIGCAVWFAARGAGTVMEDGGATPFTSSAKVVLTGTGADEQLAGYCRHRLRFRTAGLQGLLQELSMELGRISTRNLGRDDRVAGDHGKEARFPYLDEAVVGYLNSLPVWLKADLSLPRGVGDKRLLRSAARRLGLDRAAVLPKRAMQFGSRVAKMEDRREKASDRCSRLLPG